MKKQLEAPENAQARAVIVAAFTDCVSDWAKGSRITDEALEKYPVADWAGTYLGQVDDEFIKYDLYTTIIKAGTPPLNINDWLVSDTLRLLKIEYGVADSF